MATDEVKYLRSLQAIRERCGRVLALAREGKLKHFTLDESKLDDVALFVLETAKAEYPGGMGTVKFHSRWRHFEPNGVDRVGEMEGKWGECDALERARRHIDLAVVSVLLDAGAGPAWKYTEPGTGHVLSRSEGLGVASFHMFCSGAFSSDAAQPFQADAAALAALSPEAVSTAFQAGPENPLVGAEGRAALLRRLGEALAGNDTHFKGADAAAPHRPGNMVDFLLTRATDGANGRRSVPIDALWECVLDGLQAMWPATRTSLHGANMGDVWPHSGLGGDASKGENLVPFHKLSQWLTYSLMEPLKAGGIDVVGMEQMTGLAEYRNGGLLVDLGVLVPSAEVLAAPLEPHAEAIVEWRALTVALLDKVAELFRAHVGMSEAELPLVVILEAGTWKAGRVAAKRERADGSPPIKIVSDGTVF